MKIKHNPDGFPILAIFIEWESEYSLMAKVLEYAAAYCRGDKKHENLDGDRQKIEDLKRKFINLGYDEKPLIYEQKNGRRKSRKIK
jgi:hypothetical protein